MLTNYNQDKSANMQQSDFSNKMEGEKLKNDEKFMYSKKYAHYL